MDGETGPHGPGQHADWRSEEGLVHLWRAHRKWVAAVVYAHKPREADLEDLMQDVAIRLIRNIHTLDEPEAIRPWLRTVAMNVARSAGRRESSRSRAHRAIRGSQTPDKTASLGRAIEQPGIERSVENARARGRRALELAASLPDHYREPLLLSLRGLSQKQIARVMNVPITTIETRLIRSRRMLQQELLNEESNQEHARRHGAASRDEYSGYLGSRS